MGRPIKQETLHVEIRKLLPKPIWEETFENTSTSIDKEGLPRLKEATTNHFRDGLYEVAVETCGDNLSVFVYGTKWTGPHTQVNNSKLLATFNWRMMKKAALFDILRQTIEEARRIRRSKYETCTECKEDTPPEHMGEINGKPVCHGCMTIKYGVVF